MAEARTTVRPVDGLPMLHVEHARLSGAARVVKAVFDRAGAALGLVMISPLLLVIAVAIKRDSRGPILFRQVRVGRSGRELSSSSSARCTPTRSGSGRRCGN